MEYSFEKLKQIQEEIMNSNLSDETKKEAIADVTEKFFVKINEQKTINDNIEFVRQK